MATGAYSAIEIFLHNGITTAPALSLHGQGSTVTCTGVEGLLLVEIPIAIKDLNLVATAAPDNIALVAMRPTTLENVTIRASAHGLFVDNTKVTARNLQIETTDPLGTGISLLTGAELVLDRGVIKNGRYGISGSVGTQVDITNLLVFGTREVAMNLSQTGGLVSFTTVADSGAETPSGPRAFICGTLLTIRSSIVWVPSSPARPAIGGLGGLNCTLVDVIAGTAAVAGASNSNPNFMDPTGHDYHLGPGSPARDMSNVGPSIDFENEARPRGARYDVGADESD